MNKDFKNNELLQGLIWNYGSLAIMSVSGLLFNFLIVLFYDAAALGIFNRTYAWYCVLSQITVCGVHMSVLKSTSEYKDNSRERKTIILSALLEVLMLSSMCVTIFMGFLPYVVTDNKDFLTSMQLAMPGLIFLSLNKVIMNYLNGLSEMKIYALFQSLRYIAIVAALYIMGELKFESTWLSFAFTGAEVIVFLCSISYLIYKNLLGKRTSIKYIKMHMRFGVNILPASVVVELNTKVDIICLGFILRNDYLIGIYSFAVVFAEGFYQLYITVRRSINPKITECYVNNNFRQGIEKINANLKKYLTWISPVVLVLIAAGYCILCLVLNQIDYIAGVKFLVVICTAILLNGRKVIFGNIFSQIGFPVVESLINMITVAFNFLLNFILISLFGLCGAAVATAISHMIYGIIWQYNAKKRLNVKI
jgi:O-antigen/teichoic acid export membrane protein